MKFYACRDIAGTSGNINIHVEVRMKRTPMATALRTCCAERTRAMQLAVCVHPIFVPVFMERLSWEQHGHKFNERDYEK